MQKKTLKKRTAAKGKTRNAVPASVTIKDVAAAAAVSTATVSRVFSGSELVTESTVKKVKQAAKKLNFTINPLYAILGGHRRQIVKDKQAAVAFINAGFEDASIKSLERYAPYHNLQVKDIRLTAAADIPKVQEQLLQINTAGVIFRDIPAELLAGLDLSPYVVLSIHKGESGERQYNSIGGDRFYEMMTAWEKAAAAGHRRIGAAACTMPISSFDDSLRYGAIAAAQKLLQKQIEVIPPFIGAVGDTEGFIAWFKYYRPTCVIGFQMNLYWKLIDEKFRIPEDVSYIALIHGDEDDAYYGKEITGFFNVDDEVCRVTLAQLAYLLRQRVCGLPQSLFALQIASRWNNGKTLATLPTDNKCSPEKG